MIDLALDPITHDFQIVNNDLFLLDGADRVRQHLTIKLRLWTGEWFLDTEFGTPYLTDILGKQISLAGSVAALKASILAVDGVETITRFEYVFNRSARNLDVNFDVRTPYGLITVIPRRQLSLNEIITNSVSSDFVFYENELDILTNITIPSHGY